LADIACLSDYNRNLVAHFLIRMFIEHQLTAGIQRNLSIRYPIRGAGFKIGNSKPDGIILGDVGPLRQAHEPIKSEIRTQKISALYGAVQRDFCILG